MQLHRFYSARTFLGISLSRRVASKKSSFAYVRTSSKIFELHTVATAPKIAQQQQLRPFSYLTDSFVVDSQHDRRLNRNVRTLSDAFIGNNEELAAVPEATTTKTMMKNVDDNDIIQRRGTRKRKVEEKQPSDDCREGECTEDVCVFATQEAEQSADANSSSSSLKKLAKTTKKSKDAKPSSDDKQTRQRKFWVGVASLDHVQVGISDGIAQFCHGKEGPAKRPAKGDFIVYYSPSLEFKGRGATKAASSPCKSFTAIGRFADAAPYKVTMSSEFSPFRRDVEYEKNAKPVAIADILDEMDFIRNKKCWGVVFRFGFLEIDERSFSVISQHMLGRNIADEQK